MTSFCWTKHSNSSSIVRRAKTRGCFEWSLSMPASFIGKVRSPKRAFHFPRGATLRWQPSQPERANIFTSWKGKRQVPQQEQLQCLSADGRPAFREGCRRLTPVGCRLLSKAASRFEYTVENGLLCCSSPTLHFIWLGSRLLHSGSPSCASCWVPLVNAWRHQMIEHPNLAQYLFLHVSKSLTARTRKAVHHILVKTLSWICTVMVLKWILKMPSH